MPAESDPARREATRNAQTARAAPGAQAAPDQGPAGPPGTPPGQANEVIAELTRTLGRYADAVSFSVQALEPVLEFVRLAAREAETHPENSWGAKGASNLRESEQALAVIYERLRRMGAPTAVAG